MNITKPASIGKQTTYTYDGLGRLVSETTVDGSGTDVISYTYDSRGNRATMTENGIVTTYTYDANNRMTAEQTGLNVKTFTYDANGNQLVALYNFNPAGTYAYSLFGYQTSYTPDNVGYTYYTYRADGLRHSVGSTVHVWDGTNIVADVSGSTTTVYFRGIGLIYAETAGVQTYYHQNAHGDVIMLTDGMGNILKTYEYDAFGREWDALDTDNNPFRYCGEYFDKQTETVYLRARYYDSAYGRFTQEDPIRSGTNWYSYCNGNPVMYVDPFGLRRTLAEHKGTNESSMRRTPSEHLGLNEKAECDPVIGQEITNETVERRTLSEHKGITETPISEETYIYDQNTDERTINQKLGLCNMSFNGCECIAIYNSMIYLGNSQKFNDVVNWCENNILWLGGLFGCKPKKAGEYYKEQGYLTTEINKPTSEDLSDLLNDNDAVIFSYWNGSSYLSSLHTILIVKNEDGSYETWNLWNDLTNETGGYDFSADINKNRNSYYAIGISK